MNRKTAEAVVAEIKNRFKGEDFTYGPYLRDCYHEELSDGSWSIDWEDGPYEWAYEYVTKVPGVFVEPIYSSVLGVFDA